MNWDFRRRTTSSRARAPQNSLNTVCFRTVRYTLGRPEEVEYLRELGSPEAHHVLDARHGPVVHV